MPSLSFCGLVPNDPDPSIRVTLAGNMAREAVLGATGLIPSYSGVPIGSIAKGLITVMWDQDVDIWQMLSRHIEALVRNLINEQELKQLTSDIKGLRDAWKNYAEETDDNPQKAGHLTALIDLFTKERPRFLDANRPERTLPHLIALGTMHLLLLHEQATRFRAIYKADDPQASIHRGELRSAITEYFQALRQARAKAMDVRKTFMHLESDVSSGSGYSSGWTRSVYTVYDDLRGDSRSYTHYISAGRGGVSEWGADARDEARGYMAQIQNERAGALGADLDRFLAPTRSWIWLDPDQERPRVSDRVVASDVLGASHGTVVSASAPAGAIITKVQGAFSGDRLARLTLTFRDAAGHDTTAAIGTGGDARLDLTLTPGECVTAVCVSAGDGIQGLQLLTNMANTAAGGQSTGARRLLTSPTDDPAMLSGIKGWTDPAGQIIGLQLEWRMLGHVPTRGEALQQFWQDRLGGIPQVLGAVSAGLWSDFFARFRQYPNPGDAAAATSYILQNAVAQRPDGSVDYGGPVGSEVWGWTLSNAPAIALAAVSPSDWNGFMNAFQSRRDPDDAWQNTTYFLQSASVKDAGGHTDYSRPESGWVWSWVERNRRMLYHAR